MTYALVIPPEYLAKMVKVREKTGVSIRRQALRSIGKDIGIFIPDKK